MNSSVKKKIQKTSLMNINELKTSVQMFFPELDKIIQNKIDDKKYVNILVYEDYAIDGFSKEVEISNSIESGVRTKYLRDEDYVYLLLVSCKYYESGYHKQHQPVDYINVFKYLSENRIKHEFWFL